MRTLYLVLIFQLLLVATPVSAADAIEDATFKVSLIKGCEGGLLKSALLQYASFSGKKTDDILPETQEKIKNIIVPINGACSCMAEKASIKVERDGEKITKFSLDASAMATPNECAPEPTLAMRVQRDLWMLYATAPPPHKVLRIKRVPFVVDIAVIGGQPSLFASDLPLPETTPQVVLLAPGTGSACSPNDVCIAKRPLALIQAGTLLSKERHFLGEEGSQSLKQMMDVLGSDMPVVTSGHNFTNFTPSPSTKDTFEYHIRFIDGVAIEKTQVKQLWLVVFAGTVPSDPRATTFSPSRVSVTKVEFQDE